jgi:transient receptor potential cation channel subfamily C
MIPEHSVTNISGGGSCSLLEEYRDQPHELNINCVDPLDRSALITAIENENIDLIRILLEWNIDVKVHVSI